MKKDYIDYSAMVERERMINKVPVNNGWFDDVINKIEGLEKNENGCLVELNSNNYELLENNSNNDDRYVRYFRKKILDYWCPEEDKSSVMFNKKALLDLIVMIDYEYSANIWRYSLKRSYIYSMIDYITNPKNDFWNRLKKGCPFLVRDLKKSCGKKYGGPENLASKICCCFSELFYGKENYYINDRIVRRVLPYYLNYYGVYPETKQKINFKTIGYKRLHDYMDDLKKATGLNRHQLDFIMWYSYRFESEKSVKNTLRNRVKTIG